MSRIAVGAATDVGLVRPVNQDQLLVAPGLYAVADGMGGHAAGEVASSTAIAALQAAYEASGAHSLESLESAARAANRAVWEQARVNRGMLGMGTTLVALAVVERADGTNGLAVAHIGDSRLYLLRDGALHQLTVDHSLVQELVDDGQISPEQAAVHPQRHVLTRALGVEPSVAVDVLDILPEQGDRYLLCSDGLPREAADEQIAAVLQRFADPVEAAKELVALAKSRGGNDNITVVVVDVGPGDGPPSTIVVPWTEAERPHSEDATADGLAGGGSQGLPGGARATEVPGGRATMALPLARPQSRAAARPGSAAGPEGQGVAPGPLPNGGTGTGGRHATSALEGPVLRSSPARPARRFTWRVAGFALAVCAVVGGAIGALAWYARSTYYVGLDRGHITIYQGRPGGVLWFDATVAQQTRYTTASVLSSELPNLHAGELFSSMSLAHQYISRLLVEKAEAAQPVPANARGAPHRRTATSAPARSGRPRSPATSGARPTTTTT